VPRLVVLTDEQEVQFKRMWFDRVSVAEIGFRLGLTKNGVNLIRSRLGLLSRRESATRARAKREPYRDPTPEEIVQRAAEARARHLAARLAEPEGRLYHKIGEIGGRFYKSDVFGDCE